jgi:4-oxalocrotonate tautomerase family enzyme
VAAQPTLLLALDLSGTFVFALGGAWTALRAVRLDIVGAVTLGMVTALGGGILRDVLIGAVPPATFGDWRYLTVATVGALIAFGSGRWLDRLVLPMDVLDAAGLGLFAVTGASKALTYGLGPGQAVILGAITGVGGGTLRDVLIRKVPAVLHSGLYAIPALVGAGITVAAISGDVYGPVAAVVATAACFLIRMLDVVLGLNAPGPPAARRAPSAVIPLSQAIDQQGDVMPLIEVTLAEGRSPEKLRALISKLTDAVVETGVAPKEAVRVIVREVPPTHWAAGDETLAERAKRQQKS